MSCFESSRKAFRPFLTHSMHHRPRSWKVFEYYAGLPQSAAGTMLAYVIPLYSLVRPLPIPPKFTPCQAFFGGVGVMSLHKVLHICSLHRLLSLLLWWPCSKAAVFSCSHPRSNDIAILFPSWSAKHRCFSIKLLPHTPLHHVTQTVCSCKKCAGLYRARYAKSCAGAQKDTGPAQASSRKRKAQAAVESDSSEGGAKRDDNSTHGGSEAEHPTDVKAESYEASSQLISPSSYVALMLNPGYSPPLPRRGLLFPRRPALPYIGSVLPLHHHLAHPLAKAELPQCHICVTPVPTKAELALYYPHADCKQACSSMVACRILQQCPSFLAVVPVDTGYC